MSTADQMNAVSEPLAGWDAYLADVERICGHKITEGTVIDMLYSLYLGDLSASQAAGNVGGLQHASIGVKQALDRIATARSQREAAMAYRDTRTAMGWRGKGRVVRRDPSIPLQVLPRRPRHVANWAWCIGTAIVWILGAAALALVVEHFQ